MFESAIIIIVDINYRQKMNLINAFQKIPEILNLNLTPENMLNWVKNEFETELGFDFVLIGYLNSEGIDIKTMTPLNEFVQFSSQQNFGINFKDFLEQRKGIKLEIKKDGENILGEIGLRTKKNCNLALLPLNIRGAIFGIILGLKFDANISEEDFIISKAFAELCSYSIKDAELSNVFKLQLKILNENIVEKTYTIEDIKEQNEKIREAEKIKTEFLMNMSHALRTPLNAIIGFSEALEMKVFGELNDKQHEYIVDIQNSGKEMLGLVNDILDMSKIEAGAMRILKTELNINLIVKEALNIVKSLADKKNITLKANLPQNDVCIMADSQKFNQILFNLLSNAIKFTNEKGNIEIGVVPFKDKIQIYVKDDGVGIDKKYHGKIFGKFEQVENTHSHQYASSGLGLTITKELIEMHNGKIWLESKLNNGTTFTFELPAE